MTDYDNEYYNDREPMIGVLLSNEGELCLPQWFREDFAVYTSNPEVVYYMTKDLRCHPDIQSWVDDNWNILEKVKIDVRIHEIPQKFKNHYYIKLNEDFVEELVIDMHSYERYHSQWSNDCKMRYISAIIADPERPDEEKVKRVDKLIKLCK
jgi:hypothetical protein